MKKIPVIILAGVVCVMLFAAGCTSSPGTTPATPAATTAAPMTTLLTVPTSAISAPESPSWSGTWNTSYSNDTYGAVTEVITLTQTGSSVTGIYHAGKGTLNGTVQEGRLAGIWHDSDTNGTYSGFFTFNRSADKKSFTGRWVNTADGADALKNTTQFWNGVMVPATMTAPAAASASEKKSWSGIWSTIWTSEDDPNLTAGDDITFTQTGSSVSGTYINASGNYTGSLTGTVQGTWLNGTWSENDKTGTYGGPMKFELSADGNSFIGTWTYTQDGAYVQNNATYLWNGVRR